MKIKLIKKENSVEKEDSLFTPAAVITVKCRRRRDARVEITKRSQEG